MEKAMSLNEIMSMVKGYQTTQVIVTAVDLGIFEQLADKTSAMDLASKLNTNARFTERLLNACVGLGLVIRENAPSNGSLGYVYQNSASATKWLLRSSPLYFTSVVDLHGQDLYKLWSGLPNIIKRGVNQVSADSGTLWDNETVGAYRSEERTEHFMSAMRGYVAMDGTILQTVDFSKYKNICDLGAGSGYLSSQIAQMNPHVSVTLFDIAQVTSLLPKFLKPKPENLQVVTGDFFHDNLPQADLFIMSFIIHDWNDQNSVKLLRRVYESLPEGGSVMLLERCLNESKDGPVDILLYDLNMAVHTEGQERSPSEYETLLKQAGFSHVQISILSKGNNKDVIIGTKINDI